VSVTHHHELAQVNVARLRAPLDTPQLADFVANLEPVNALADGAPGFVWRLQTEDGNATAVRVLDDDMLIVNMSVWRSLDALSAFVYGGGHREVMRRRRQWFERLTDAHVALWWVEAGTRPTVAEAERRLVLLRTHGPTREAFTFRTPFPVPGAAGPVAADDDWRCPAG
jgi:heme-degrading monooxygenase HmoA